MRWLRFRVLRDSRRWRDRAKAWLDAHPRIARFLERTGCLNVDEYTLARGAAIGLFIGLTPTVGIQVVLLVIASMIFRANFPVALVLSFISNPLTMAPLYFGFNRLGEVILGVLPVPTIDWPGIRGLIAEETLETIVGSLAIAAPAAALGYFVFLWAWRKLKSRVAERAARKVDDEGR